MKKSEDLISDFFECLKLPEGDAMEIVRQVRKTECDWEDMPLFTLTDTEAAALIASYSRRVPRAMLDEIWLIGNRSKPGQKDIDTAEIADRHGYKVEG